VWYQTEPRQASGHQLRSNAHLDPRLTGARQTATASRRGRRGRQASSSLTCTRCATRRRDRPPGLHPADHRRHRLSRGSAIGSAYHLRDEPVGDLSHDHAHDLPDHGRYLSRDHGRVGPPHGLSHHPANRPAFDPRHDWRNLPRHHGRGRLGYRYLDRPGDGPPDDDPDAYPNPSLSAWSGIICCVGHLHGQAPSPSSMRLNQQERTDEAFAGPSLPAPCGDCPRMGTVLTSGRPEKTGREEREDVRCD
jgi:hypothetical protein